MKTPRTIDRAIPTGYRILQDQDVMREGDLAWGFLADHRVGWGLLPQYLAGHRFSTTSMRHPQFVIRKETP